MRLNHLSLVVDDLDEAQELFARSFGFEWVDRKGYAVAVMADGQGLTLVLSNARAFGGEPTTGYPEGLHVGFILRTR